MSQLKYRTETEAYRALVDVVPFAVRDAIGAEIYRASNGEEPCLHEARTLARKYCSPGCIHTALEVINEIDFDAIRATAIAEINEREQALGGAA
jgi:hypothetical protein